MAPVPAGLLSPPRRWHKPPSATGHLPARIKFSVEFAGIVEPPKNWGLPRSSPPAALLLAAHAKKLIKPQQTGLGGGIASSIGSQRGSVPSLSPRDYLGLEREILGAALSCASPARCSEPLLGLGCVFSTSVLIFAQVLGEPASPRHPIPLPLARWRPSQPASRVMAVLSTWLSPSRDDFSVLQNQPCPSPCAPGQAGKLCGWVTSSRQLVCKAVTGWHWCPHPQQRAGLTFLHPFITRKPLPSALRSPCKLQRNFPWCRWSKQIPANLHQTDTWRNPQSSGSRCANVAGVGG